MKTRVGQRFYLVTQGDAYRIAPHYVTVARVDDETFTLSNGVKLKHNQRNHKWFKLFDSYEEYIIWKNKAKRIFAKKK